MKPIIDLSYARSITQMVHLQYTRERESKKNAKTRTEEEINPIIIIFVNKVLKMLSASIQFQIRKFRLQSKVVGLVFFTN